MRNKKAIVNIARAWHEGRVGRRVVCFGEETLAEGKGKGRAGQGPYGGYVRAREGPNANGGPHHVPLRTCAGRQTTCPASWCALGYVGPCVGPCRCHLAQVAFGNLGRKTATWL